MARGSSATGLSGRYAVALFDAAREQNALAAVEADLAGLKALGEDSDDWRRLLASPLVERDAAARAVHATAGELKLNKLTTGLLGVLARNRRLAALPDIIRAFTALAAAHRGEATARVTSAQPLTGPQQAALKDQLKAHLRQEVSVETHVDPAILGGLVVEIGSRRIDASIRSKLAAIGAAMKG